MKPVIVIPFHDPDGILLPFLAKIERELKAIFEQAILSISPQTAQRQVDALRRLSADSFYQLIHNDPNTLPGEHYINGWRYAVAHFPADCSFHLCDLDRFAFALDSYRATFLDDLAWASAQTQPVLFQRSAAAWATHPSNYRELEGMINRVGELLFGTRFDFAWSHAVLRGHHLRDLLDHLTGRDFVILIEMVLLLREQLLLRAVDWLAWEDPYILGVSAETLRHQRENSQTETEKRIRGLLPFFNALHATVEPLSPERTWSRPTFGQA